MAKETKKPVRKVALPILNKSNLLKLADSIYLDTGDQVTFTKLCDGGLCNGSGKKVMHCAIGEAYHVFVSSDHKDMLKLNKTENYRSPHLSYDYDEDEDIRCLSFQPIETETEVDDPGTIKAVDELVARADLKKKGPAAQKELALALLSVVTDNDGADDFAIRAQYVSQGFHQVAKLLK